MGRMWAAKLGLSLAAVEGYDVEGAAAVLAQELLGMMGGHPCDYTLIWRQLAQVCTYICYMYSWPRCRCAARRACADAYAYV